MAESTTGKYDVQVISGRYIRSVVFDAYVIEKVAEFGDKWKRDIERDNRITFTALRKLTDDELYQLQLRSYPSLDQRLFV